MRALALLLLATLAACATQAPPPPPVVNTAEALRQRLPDTIAGFRRGSSTTLSEPSTGEGTELAYATANRAIAGYVQVLRRDPALAPGATEEELVRFVADSTSGTPMHRRLRQRAVIVLPAAQPALRCAELEGTYGRQAVESLACVGIFGGQLVRLRLTHIRRESRMAEARGFAEALAAALTP